MAATDLALIKRRCSMQRRRILEISQGDSALHIVPAFSCTEITDTIFNELMAERDGADLSDIFIISKAHRSMSQYAVLENNGLLSKTDLDHYYKPDDRLGTQSESNQSKIAVRK